jgi:translation initiation factor IF-2
MVDVTVLELAETIGTPADKLLKQMSEAGLPQSTVEDSVTDEQKQKLLLHLKTRHGESDEAPKKITLKRKTLSKLKATGSSARGRTVNVEVRKKRTYVRRSNLTDTPVTPESEESVAAPVTETPSRTSEEETRRKAAQADADEQARRKEEAELKAKQEAEEAAQLEAQELEKKQKEGTPEVDKTIPVVETDLTDKPSARKDKRDRHDLDDEEIHAHETKVKKHKGDRRKKTNLVEEVLSEIELDSTIIDEEIAIDPEKVAETSSTLGLSKGRGKKSAKKPARRRIAKNQHQFTTPTEDVVHEVEVGESITVSALSQKMTIKAAEVIKVLMGLGVMATINQTIDQETAILVIEELGHKVKVLDDAAIEKEMEGSLVYEGESAPRAPVVTVMGHVDHGKTSLLDYIRESQVADGEAGGITQHIGAYRVETDQGLICFIDTPGHAAFTAMRARGAQSTDIVILVVASDDGVMPQTEEAIQHARAAEVPLVVAINKIDKEGADIDRVKNELSAKEVIPEDWGGDTQFVPVSAHTGEGINELLEAILLQAELLELTAVCDGPAQGVVIESELDKGRGSVATLLIQNGTLNQGDLVVAGEQYGRVRAMKDENNKSIKEAGPSTPVTILGLDGTPGAGDPFVVTTDERKARELAEFRRVRSKDQRLASPVVTLDNIFDSLSAGEVSYLNVVVKADVRGSLEAINSALLEIGNEEVKVNIVSSGVGGITESDVTLAVTAGAVIFGFNVRTDATAKKLVEEQGVDVRYYKVIYDIIDDVKAALSGMLSPEVREEIAGIATVKEVFRSKKFGLIAGCMVTEGTVSRNKRIRVLRDNVVIFEGELESLRHFKEEVTDIRSGTECGIGVKNYSDVRENDQIEVFDTREVAREL